MHHRVLKPLLAAVIAIQLCSCSESGSSTTSSSASAETSSPDTFKRIDRVTYEHGNDMLTLVGIPTSATAYSGTAVAARAIVKYNGDLAPGSLRTLEVEETHYDGTGTVIYRGTILFEPRLDSYVVKEEHSMMGRRPVQVFANWPKGRG